MDCAENDYIRTFDCAIPFCWSLDNCCQENAKADQLLETVAKSAFNQLTYWQSMMAFGIR